MILAWRLLDKNLILISKFPMIKFVEVESFIGSISIATKLDSISADREYYPSLQKLLCLCP